MSKSAKVIFSILTSTLLIGSALSASAAPKAATYLAIDSLTFNSTKLIKNNKPVKLASKKAISIRFANKRISINAGCNTMTSAFTLNKGLLKTAKFASTRMACSEALMKQDLWLTNFLEKPVMMKIDGQILTITNGKNKITFKLLETYGPADTPLGDENSEAAVKAACEKLLQSKATESEAQQLAEQSGFLFRVLARDGEEYPATMDYRVNRMNVKIANSVVVDCYGG